MGRATLCPSCGIALREAARFCDACGAALPASPARAEYKQATVLFADVVRSMDIASRLGAERLREIMTQLVNRCSDVVRLYGGTVDKFTGDGIMALFGAPAALEDHALRACLAALGIRDAARVLAAEVEGSDGIELRLRVGLNSGEVIAGETGAGAIGYTAIGEQVGMAQRMESAAPPDEVLLSESTARLVEHAVVLGEPELLQLKGFHTAVLARRLLTAGADRACAGRHLSTLVGRSAELTTLAESVERARIGQACIVSVVGPPGIGKSRIVSEAAALARDSGVDVVVTYCESHANGLPFHAGARLLREVFGVSGLEPDLARGRIRTAFADADPDDVKLFEDLLGIREPGVDVPEVGPDARRRRLRTLINASLSARSAATMYVIEDVHWIDELSDAMLDDFISAVSQTPSVVVLTYRPEYRGALSQVPGHTTISLAGLADSHMSALVTEALGSDPSVSALSAQICERASGNPFFAEEITRELAARGVLAGARGAYTCSAEETDISVPATLQAAIAARIDRLGGAAKQTLYCASVIGARFDTDLLDSVTAAANSGALTALVDAELIEQIAGPSADAEYVFRHPLIRSVAYTSQLKSERAALHRRFAAAIEQRDPPAADQNAALIAEHLEAARDLRAALAWHLRAGTWSATCDIRAARISWRRAHQVADRLPADDAARTALRIMPRTMLCATGWRVGMSLADSGFHELQELVDAAGDEMSRTIVKVLLAADHYRQCHFREAARLASEVIAVAESASDPDTAIRLLSGVLVQDPRLGNRRLAPPVPEGHRSDRGRSCQRPPR